MSEQSKIDFSPPTETNDIKRILINSHMLKVCETLNAMVGNIAIEADAKRLKSIITELEAIRQRNK